MARRRLSVAALTAAIFFMVSGGPFGLEEIVSKTGYLPAIALLLVVPLAWSLPTAAMVAELVSAIPQDGGFYVWVERALGSFWGFQEAWLSLAASIFDMAIYPSLFVLYLGHFVPASTSGSGALAIGWMLIAACVGWNLRGAREVGDSSIALGIILLLPFGFLAIAGFMHGPASRVPTRPAVDIAGAVLIAMWNYMGWDNASTIAGEVEAPRRAYPKALLISHAAIAACYVLPVLAVRAAGLDPSGWETGSWVDAGRTLGGATLAFAIAAAGAASAAGMLNALVLSYSRLPAAMARDGFLPSAFSKENRRGVPVLSVVVCAAAWALCLVLGFDRLVELDILLYGTSLILEFVALLALRRREPELVRPYRIPGGPIAIGLWFLLPAALLAFAFVRNATEKIAGVRSIWLGLALIAAGPLLYLAAAGRRGSSGSRNLL